MFTEVRQAFIFSSVISLFPYPRRYNCCVWLSSRRHPILGSTFLKFHQDNSSSSHFYDCPCSTKLRPCVSKVINESISFLPILDASSMQWITQSIHQSFQLEWRNFEYHPIPRWFSGPGTSPTIDRSTLKNLVVPNYLFSSALGPCLVWHSIHIKCFWQLEQQILLLVFIRAIDEMHK